MLMIIHRKVDITTQCSQPLSGVGHMPGQLVSSARATELAIEHVASSVSTFLLVFRAKRLFRAVCHHSATGKMFALRKKKLCDSSLAYASPSFDHRFMIRRAILIDHALC